jgi:hypothetical protein
MEEISLFLPNLNRRATQEPPKPAQTLQSHSVESNTAKLNPQIDYQLQPANAPPGEAGSTILNQQIFFQMQIISTMAQPQQLNNKLSSPIEIFFEEDTTTPFRKGNVMTTLSVVHHQQNSPKNHKQNRINIANTTELTSTDAQLIQCISDNTTSNNANLTYHNPP